MINKILFAIYGGIGLIASVVMVIIARGGSLDIIQPQGPIGTQQRDLLYFALGLSVLVVVPVFIMAIWFSVKYSAKNKKAEYKPDWSSNSLLETIWWAIPIILILILAIVTWRSSHALDPYKPLVSNKTPVRVQVVALQWKWLFIYPDYNIATVNYLKVPVYTPVEFSITSDAPMNSLWIPALGGQVYAMSGMQTKLHLQADNIGEFNGVSANISGEGFADMRFKMHSTDDQDFENWVSSVRRNGQAINWENYQKLAKPSVEPTTKEFSDVQPMIFEKIINQYMSHGHENE